MKQVPLDSTFEKIKELPEEVSYEEMAKWLISTPVVVGTGLGLWQLTAHLLKTKYFIPMFFSGSLALGWASWLAVTALSPSTMDGGNASPLPKKAPVQYDARKDQPWAGLEFFPDSSGKKRKRVVRKQETRIIHTNGDSSLAPLPALPPLPPSPQGAEVETEEVRKVVRKQKPVKSKADGGCGADDPFVHALLGYLKKENLHAEGKPLQIKLQPKSFELNGTLLGKNHLEKAIQLFKKHEKQVFSGDSMVEVSINRGRCSISKSIGDRP